MRSSGILTFPRASSLSTKTTTLISLQRLQLSVLYLLPSQIATIMENPRKSTSLTISQSQSNQTSANPPLLRSRYPPNHPPPHAIAAFHPAQNPRDLLHALGLLHASVLPHRQLRGEQVVDLVCVACLLIHPFANKTHTPLTQGTMLSGIYRWYKIMSPKIEISVDSVGTSVFFLFPPFLCLFFPTQELVGWRVVGA